MKAELRCVEISFSFPSQITHLCSERLTQPPDDFVGQLRCCLSPWPVCHGSALRVRRVNATITFSAHKAGKICIRALRNH